MRRSDFKDKRVVVVGDSILDCTIYTDALGLSLESPTLKVLKDRDEYSFGGAANVVQNLISLGAGCTYITALGMDEYSDYYSQWDASTPQLTLKGVFDDRKNTVKTRIWVARGQDRYKYLQINQQVSGSLSRASRDKLISELEDQVPRADVLLLVDYGLGVL